MRKTSFEILMPEMVAALICAELRKTGNMQLDGQVAVLEWCNGQTRSGEHRPDLFVEEPNLLRALLVALHRKAVALHIITTETNGHWTKKSVLAVEELLDEGTRLCNGGPGGGD